MNSGDVEKILVIMESFLQMMGFNFDNTDPVPLQHENIDQKNTEMLVQTYSVLLKDVVILGFLSWLAKNRHDALDMMFKFDGNFCIYLVK